MNATNMDLVVNDLTQQIAQLSKEKAIYFSLASSKAAEVTKLKKENEELKKQINELDKTSKEHPKPKE